MTPEKISALISLIVAVVILIANYVQWYDITYDGAMRMKTWVDILLKLCILALLISGYFLFKK